MSDPAADATRIAGGPKPSSFVPGPGQPAPEPAQPLDPLRLCIFATIALLGWMFGPLAVVVFASVGFAGYLKARRAGLLQSKCYLRDTRLVLAYLALLGIAGLWGGWFALQRWLG